MSDKFETLLATHCEAIRSLTDEEFSETDKTLEALTRDALLQAKCLGAGDERENAALLCAASAKHWRDQDVLHDKANFRAFAYEAEHRRDQIRSGERAVGFADAPEVPPGEWTPELVEAFNDFHAAALKPDAEVRRKTLLRHDETGRTMEWDSDALPADLPNGYSIVSKPSTAPPADEGWHKTADEKPPENMPVRVRFPRDENAWLYDKRQRTEDDRWLDAKGAYKSSLARDVHEFEAWPEWSFIADQPKADEGQKWTVVWGMDNRLCCKVCGHPFLGISGDWTHVCQSKADAPVETRMPLFLHSDCAAVCQFEGMVDSHNARVAERDEAMKMCKGWQREATNSYDKYREVKAERDTAYWQRNDLIRQRDELRAQLAQANAEKVAAMGEADKWRETAKRHGEHLRQIGSLAMKW